MEYTFQLELQGEHSKIVQKMLTRGWARQWQSRGKEKTQICHLKHPFNPRRHVSFYLEIDEKHTDKELQNLACSKIIKKRFYQPSEGR